VTSLVLLVDDDSAMVRKLQLVFAQEGNDVDHALPGVDAIRRLLADEPELVVLAVGSEQTGWQNCRRLLAFLDRPLFFLVSTANELDRVKGLNLGADDCMIKPVLTLEVHAQGRALLRQSDSLVAGVRQSYFADKDLVVDPTRRQVWLDGKPIALTPTEFRFLCCLTQHAGRVLSHDQLTMHVWGRNYSGTPNAIKVYIHRLRQKLESDPSHPRRILTYRGEGYLFQAIEDTQCGKVTQVTWP
jgi:DNA-binding response OmpR family regulator